MAGMEPVEFMWNHDPNSLSEFDGYFIVGGFSYEDRSRAGIIAAMDPLMPYIAAEALKGKPVLGICNGAQILVETGLVPGLRGNAVGMAIATNKRVKHSTVLGTGFYNAWVNIAVSCDPHSSAFTRHMRHGTPIRVPVAHAEGRFIIADELVTQMKRYNQLTFRYTDQNGKWAIEFPDNPNGSTQGIAAVSNPAGNVMAMMPHPERTDVGQPIFTSMRDFIADERRIQIRTLDYRVPKVAVQKYEPSGTGIVTELIITDNEAVTVEQTLRAKKIDVSVSRYSHWAATGENISAETLSKTGELFNSNKERVVDNLPAEKNTLYLMVRDKEDFVGQSKKQTLKTRFSMSGLRDLLYSRVWKISAQSGNLHEAIEAIMETNILFNPHAQDCYMFAPTAASPAKPQPMQQEKQQNMPSYVNTITEQRNNCLTRTDAPLGTRLEGKVRDRYVQDDKIILITTDRQSAFDRVLASIPFKGQVLNLTSAWWFEKTKHIIPNHVIEIPDPNVTVGKKVDVFPVEFVVRGYITGTTDTSAWVNYNKGVRDFCGNQLPEGLKKNQKFDFPIITPTTKADEHDRLISPKDIIDEGLMTQQEWDFCSRKALELFSFGQAIARERGLILVDTKYEMGRDKDGNIILVDEIHTPDSSRYWIAASYEGRMANGKEPENIDKEFLRLWFKDNCDPYNDKELPPAPPELVAELSRRYIMLYEMITGETFVFPEDGLRVEDRLTENLATYVIENKTHDTDTKTHIVAGEVELSREMKVVLVLGSEKDADFAKRITELLAQDGIAFDQHVASAHKEAAKGLDLIERYKDKRVIYVTIAGRSNALSGFMAGNSDKPVIACPPFTDKMDMLVNIHSTLQMPSKVPVMTILEPGNVVLAIKRIMSLISS